MKKVNTYQTFSFEITNTLTIKPIPLKIRAIKKKIVNTKITVINDMG